MNVFLNSGFVTEMYSAQMEPMKVLSAVTPLCPRATLENSAALMVTVFISLGCVIRITTA